MRSHLLPLVLAAVAVVAPSGQSGLSPDIDSQSLSRLPPVQRDQLNDDGKRIWTPSLAWS